MTRVIIQLLSFKPKKDTFTNIRSAKLLWVSVIVLGTSKDTVLRGHCTSREEKNLPGRVVAREPGSWNRTKRWYSPSCVLNPQLIATAPDLVWKRPRGVFCNLRGKKVLRNVAWSMTWAEKSGRVKCRCCVSTFKRTCASYRGWIIQDADRVLSCSGSVVWRSHFMLIS